MSRGLPTALALLLALAVARAGADEPMRPPSRLTVCSPSGEICATSDPAEGTFVHPAGEPEAPLWRMPGWFRVLYPADDGAHLVTGYDGINLVPTEDPVSIVVLRFWRRGEPVARWTLSDLGYRKQDLQPTVSHLHWGGYVGFDADGRFELEMVDRVSILFDVATGEVVGRKSPRPGLGMRTAGQRIVLTLLHDTHHVHGAARRMAR